MILRKRFGETWLELRTLPLSGGTSPFPHVNYRWYCWALFLIGGILGNVLAICVVACLVAGLAGIGAAPKEAGDFLVPIIFAQMCIIIASIIPFSEMESGTRHTSDGLKFLLLLRSDLPRQAAQNRAAYAKLLSAYSNGDFQLTMTSASSRILYHISSSDRLTDEEACRDFREALLRALEGVDLVREEKMLVLDALVTDGLISVDPAVRAHLDEWSEQALALGPKLPTLVGSRGAVLVELGRYEEGKALLAPLVASSPAQSFDSFMSHAFLARAERALGDEAVAGQFATVARATAQAVQAPPRLITMLARLETEIQPVN